MIGIQSLEDELNRLRNGQIPDNELPHYASYAVLPQFVELTKNCVFPALPSLSTPAAKTEGGSKNNSKVKTDHHDVTIITASTRGRKEKKGKTPPPSPSAGRRTRRGGSPTQSVDNDDNESIASIPEGRASRSGPQSGSVPPSLMSTTSANTTAKRGRNALKGKDTEEMEVNKAKRTKKDLKVITEEPANGANGSRRGRPPAGTATPSASTGRSTRGGAKERSIEEKPLTRRGGRR